MPEAAHSTDLVERVDTRGHLTHVYDVDPNRVIYEEFHRIFGPEKAQRFLDYRRLYENTRRTRQFPPHPLSVVFSLMDACQLECPHCYRQHNPDKTAKRRLTWTEIKTVIDQAAEMGAPSMLFGSETEFFMHKDAIRTLEYAAARDILDVWVSTNGHLLTPEIVERLFEVNLTRLTISIDAASAETYGKTRGDGYDQLVANIEHFLKRRAELGRRLPVLRLTFIEYNLNRHEKEEFIRFWRERKADIIDVQTLMDIRYVNTLPHDAIDRMDCTYPWEMAYVNWAGQYRPCCSEFSKHLDLGTIKDFDLAGYWNSPALRELRESFADPTKTPKTCINCVKCLNPLAEFEPIQPKRKARTKAAS
jgi:MoaA/NifB/PqqE/SkfB family radical SAM enzyme